MSELITYVSVKGTEIDDATVHYDFQPFEPTTRTDPGCDASVTVTGVLYDSLDMLDDMDSSELGELEDRILEGLDRLDDYDAYCDHKYDQMIDRRLDNAE